MNRGRGERERKDKAERGTGMDSEGSLLFMSQGDFVYRVKITLAYKPSIA